jgi:hypothetical protein
MALALALARARVVPPGRVDRHGDRRRLGRQVARPLDRDVTDPGQPQPT